MFLLTLWQPAVVATHSFLWQSFLPSFQFNFDKKGAYAKRVVVRHSFFRILYNPLPPLKGESLSFASSVQKGVIRAHSHTLRLEFHSSPAIAGTPGGVMITQLSRIVPIKFFNLYFISFQFKVPSSSARGSSLLKAPPKAVFFAFLKPNKGGSKVKNYWFFPCFV